MSDQKFRNENNRTFGDGKFFVSAYEIGKVLFIGTYEDCEKWIENNREGDFDDYGIFEN